jgi:hypothetical protein
VARHGLGQHHAELLLPERDGDRREHEARCPRVDARYLVVWHPAQQLHDVVELEVANHAAQALLLGSHSNDQRSHVGPPALTQEGERAQQILMALLPNKAADREDQVRTVRRRPRLAGRPKALDVDPRRADANAVRGSAFEQEGVAGTFGPGEKEVGRAQHRLAVRARANVAVGADERQRLPHVHRETKSEPLAQLGRLRGEPEAELGGVDDVGLPQVLLEAEVMLAHRSGAQAAEAVSRQLRADGLHRHLLELEGVRVEEVVRRHQHLHVVAAVEFLPWPQIPGIDEIAAQDYYSHRFDRIGGVRMLTR